MPPPALYRLAAIAITPGAGMRTIVAFIDTSGALLYPALDNISYNQSKMRPA